MAPQAVTTVRLSGVVKRFGATAACDGADFAAGAGGISALVGENGAGKTTLMRVLAGETAPDAGTISIGGRRARFSGPREAAAAGIGMVAQDSALIGALTVLENVILGGEGTGAFLRVREAAARLGKICGRLGLDVALDVPASTLSAPERQRLAIARALYRDARVLILDEPTTYLGPSERQALFDVIRELAAAGAVVIFISHKLPEVFEVADTITVLRHGKTVSSCSKTATSPAKVATAMVGAAFDDEAAGRAEAGEVVVRLSNVSTAGGERERLKEVSLDLRRGMISGVAGVAGNGQRALCDVTAGVLKVTSGKVAYPFGRPEVGFVGEDVDRMDLVGGMRIWENRILGREGLFRKWWGVDATLARKDTHRLAAEFDIRGDAEWPASALSGGNRQRLALARELAGAPGLFVAEEPTRGLDIRGAELVRKRLREMATAGSAVLLVSYDLDELYAIADSIFVISSGRLLEPSNQPPMRAELGALMAS